MEYFNNVFNILYYYYNIIFLPGIVKREIREVADSTHFTERGTTYLKVSWTVSSEGTSPTISLNKSPVDIFFDIINEFRSARINILLVPPD